MYPTDLVTNSLTPYPVPVTYSDISTVIFSTMKITVLRLLTMDVSLRMQGNLVHSYWTESTSLVLSRGSCFCIILSLFEVGC